MSKVVFTDYSIDSFSNESEVLLPNDITSFEAGYNRGRFYLIINGVEVFNDIGAGSDFDISCEV